MKLKIYPVFQMTLRAPLIAKGVDRFVGNFWTCPCYMTLRKCLPPYCGDPGGAPGPSPPTPSERWWQAPVQKRPCHGHLWAPSRDCDPFFCYFVILEEITWMAWLHPDQQILHIPPFSDLGGSSHLPPSLHPPLPP